MPHEVFISYSTKDKVIADAVCARLENSRIRCWIAPRDIIPGIEFGEAIIDAIQDCSIMVLIFSADANNSPQVRREVERAVGKGKIIIPFRIEGILPTKALEYALFNTHWLDALTPPLEEHILKLADAINRLLNLKVKGTDEQKIKGKETPPIDIRAEKPAVTKENIVKEKEKEDIVIHHKDEESSHQENKTELKMPVIGTPEIVNKPDTSSDTPSVKLGNISVVAPPPESERMDRVKLGDIRIVVLTSDTGNQNPAKIGNIFIKEL